MASKASASSKSSPSTTRSAPPTWSNSSRNSKPARTTNGTSCYGQVFNLALTDLPEKKTDLVTGSYTFPAPAGNTTVAVKIIDMLGEEVLVIAEV
jgi:hypothetical protein